MSSRLFRIAAAVAVLVLVGSVIAAVALAHPSRTVTAYFTSAEGVFEDNAVRVLGIPVGKITHIEPAGTRVKVEMAITDDDVRLPADARAVVVSPSVVTGRYIQFTPPYTGGPELADGAVIPIERTAVPLGVDDLTRTASQLAAALGPQGANSTGALSDAVGVGARNLDGNGQVLNQSVRDLGELSGTLSNSREALFGTVRELQSFVANLRRRDADVREFNDRLQVVAGFLADDRDDLGGAFHELSIALGEVASFVRDNRQILNTDVEKLVTVTDAVVRQRQALKEILDVAPAGLNNLANGYNSIPGTLDTRINMGQNSPSPGGLTALLCQVASQVTPGFPGTPIGKICEAINVSTSGPQALTALRALDPRELGLPAGYQFPGIAVPTDRAGAVPDVTTLPGGPAPAPALDALPAPSTGGGR